MALSSSQIFPSFHYSTVISSLSNSPTQLVCFLLKTSSHVFFSSVAFGPFLFHRVLLYPTHGRDDHSFSLCFNKNKHFPHPTTQQHYFTFSYGLVIFHCVVSLYRHLYFGHADCFQILATMDNATGNIGAQMSFLRCFEALQFFQSLIFQSYAK